MALLPAEPEVDVSVTVDSVTAVAIPADPVPIVVEAGVVAEVEAGGEAGVVAQ